MLRLRNSFSDPSGRNPKLHHLLRRQNRHHASCPELADLFSIRRISCNSAFNPDTSSRSERISETSSDIARLAVSSTCPRVSRFSVSPCLSSPYARISSLVSTERLPSGSVLYETRPLAISRYSVLLAFPVKTNVCLTLCHAISTPCLLLSHCL